MLSRAELEALSDVDITNVNLRELQELTDITISPKIHIGERMEFLLDDIKNPYCFKVNGIPVKICFNDHEKTLEANLYKHLISKIDNNTII